MWVVLSLMGWFMVCKILISDTIVWVNSGTVLSNCLFKVYFIEGSWFLWKVLRPFSRPILARSLGIYVSHKLFKFTGRVHKQPKSLPTFPENSRILLILKWVFLWSCYKKQNFLCFTKPAIVTKKHLFSYKITVRVKAQLVIDHTIYFTHISMSASTIFIQFTVFL